MDDLNPHAYTVYFFNDTATTAIYTLSLHDALPIFTATCRPSTRPSGRSWCRGSWIGPSRSRMTSCSRCRARRRSEEHTSELQSHSDLVCRLLLEKKKRQSRRSNLQTTLL